MGALMKPGHQRDLTFCYVLFFSNDVEQFTSMTKPDG
jgi:hypothetical protein